MPKVRSVTVLIYYITRHRPFGQHLTNSLTPTEDACNAAASAKKLRKLRARQANLDFGSCSNPAIEFAAGLDGRKEESFAPADAADFNHGSALNIKVISGFICGQLQSKCKAAADAVSTCNDAASAADAETGQAAADAFNSALGVSA